MNSLVKKMLVFLLVMGLVGAAGWYGRKAYKRATERRAVTEASQYLAKKDFRNASLALQRALHVNPNSALASRIMADMLDSAGAAAALTWRIRTCQLQPGNVTNRLFWAETAIKLHDSKSAADALSGFDEKSKGTATYHKLSGALAWSLDKSDEAEKHYHEALRLEPGNPAIILNLDTMALASTNTGTANAARTSLEQVATNSEFRLIALRYLTADAIARKNFAKAVNYSQKIIADPTAMVDDKIEYLQLLRLAHDAGFGSWLDKLKREATQSANDAFALGKWMAMTENPTNALHWLKTLPPAIQTNQPVPLIMADCHVALKDWQGLADLVQKEDWAEANYFRLALLSLGQRSLQQESAAKVAWHKAMRFSGHRLDRLARLSQVTAGWGWAAEKTEVLKEIVSEFPRERWAIDQLANEFYTTGNTRELGDLIAKSFANDSSNPRTKNNLANISLLRKSDLIKASRLAHEAYDSSPENPFFTCTYAYSLLLQKKQDEAVKIISNINPKYLEIPSVAAYYGVVQAESGHKDLAKGPLERASSAKLLPEENELVRLAKTRL